MVRFAVLAGFLIALAGMAFGEERSSLWPDIPRGEGAAHEEGNLFWRKNHMKMMLHDRDLTLRMGEREIEASLKGCFECHAVRDDHGAPVTYADDKHFCRVCHDFAAVKVDCFMCHRSTPDGVDEHALSGADHAGMISLPEAAGNGAAGADAAALRGYLQRFSARRGGQTAEAGQ